MTKIERLYNDAPVREFDLPREKHLSIEKPDGFFVIKNEPELIYEPPVLEDSILDESTTLGNKYKKAKELCSDTQTIKIGKKDEKIKSKRPKGKTKKNNPPPNTAAVETVQEEL